MNALPGALIRTTVYAAFTVAALAAARPGAAQSLVGVGDKAPAAVVETLDGKKVDLAQYIGQRPVLIEFWATWCPNCKQLEPTLHAVHRKYAAQVHFIGVAVSINQSPRRIRQYVEKYKLPFEVLFDREGNASGAYDVPATSYVVVVDKTGTVVYTGSGGDQDLEAAIRKAL
ncbi:MAG TPA: TlpA disulfide reductase family protein [Gemmatimonadaceae bacterium]|nr:TlpA disulfide reductase family protein [Gemmatimonadaceae bacterium]